MWQNRRTLLSLCAEAFADRVRGDKAVSAPGPTPAGSLQRD